jgi:hypothetical protein
LSPIANWASAKQHRRGGDREQAQEHLITAMTMYRELGMTYWLEQAEAELRQLGWAWRTMLRATTSA